MCLNIKSGPHIAERDIYVVKMAVRMKDLTFESPYKEYPYSYGPEYESQIEVEENQIERGIHSLNLNTFQTSGWVRFDVICFACDGGVGSGFVLCKIPKGSTYYVGDDEDIVSDKLIALGPISVQDGGAKATLLGEEIEISGYADLVRKSQLKLAERIDLIGLPETVQKISLCVL